MPTSSLRRSKRSACSTPGHDYNHVRPHSALQDRTPVEMGALWVDSRVPRVDCSGRTDRNRDRTSLRDYVAVLILRGGVTGVPNPSESFLKSDCTKNLPAPIFASIT